jgi:hypothetical protein
VEEIRRAAALMRERAQAATPGPWDVMQDAVLGQHDCEDPNCWLFVADVDHDDEKGHANQRHIASWHPAVALAVADLLDTLAVGIESAAADRCENAYIDEAAVLAVARTCLAGEQP